MTKNKDTEKIILEVDDSELEEVKVEKKTKRVLAFSLGGENYCVDIDQAKEVIRPPEITRVPNTPEFIVGIINLRGEIIAVVDIRHFFGLQIQEKSKDIRVIVTDVGGSAVGILVDKVEATLDIEEDLIQPPLATLKKELLNYTKGQAQYGDKILIILDLGKILKCEEIENLKKGGE